MEKKVSCSACSKELIPICNTCYISQFKGWMQDNSIPKDLQKKIIVKLQDSKNHKTECLLCEKKNANLCITCFYENLENEIKNLKVDEEETRFYELISNYVTFMRKL